MKENKHCDETTPGGSSGEEGISGKYSQILIAILPTFLTSILDVYIDMHLTKYYMEDICKYYSDKSCIEASRFGLVNSFIRSLSLITDFFSATLIDSSSLGQQTLLMICAPIYWMSIVGLFLGPSLYRSEMIPTFIWFIICSLLKNMVPLRVLYDTSIVRMCKLWNVKDRSDLFSVKHQASMYGGVLGAFLPSLLRFILSSLTLSENQITRVYIMIGSLLIIGSYVFMSSFFRNSREMNSFKKEKTEEKKSVSWIPALKKCFENRAFVALLCLFSYETLRGLLWNGLYIFYITKVLNLEGANFDFWTGVLNTTGMIFAMIFSPLWQYMASKYGNYNTWLVSYLVQIPIGVFVYLFVDYSSTEPQIWNYLPFFVLLTITGRSSGFLLDSIKTTVFDYDELRTGERREISLEATWSFLPRYIDLISSSVSFGILSYFNTYGLSVEERTSLKSGTYTLMGKHSISVQAALLPSLTSIVCLFLMYRFPINDQKHAEILDLIRKRKEEDNRSKIIDPLTGEEIIIHEESDKNSQKINKKSREEEDYFFTFELDMIKSNTSWYGKWLVEIEIITTISMTILFGIFGYKFIMNVLFGEDIYASLFLWLSSVTFTLSTFFFSRISVAKKLRKQNCF